MKSKKELLATLESCREAIPDYELSNEGGDHNNKGWIEALEYALDYPDSDGQAVVKIPSGGEGTHQSEAKGNPLFGRFYNPKHLDDYITSLCHGDVRTGDLYILVGMFERTVKEGWTSLDIYQRDSETSLSDSRHVDDVDFEDRRKNHDRS